MCGQLQHIETDINVDRELSVSPIKAISLAKTDWWDDTSVIPAGRETCVNAGILLQYSFVTQKYLGR